MVVLAYKDIENFISGDLAKSGAR
eukprot:COSAG05_NODE_5171_length_1245_cov_1.628272_2_plen_23_part_01